MHMLTVDEILYHAHVHPEERCDVLTDAQVTALHKQTSEVCITAVSVNADDTKFPEDWLFKHRWVRLCFNCPPHFADICPPFNTFRGRVKRRNILLNLQVALSC